MTAITNIRVEIKAKRPVKWPHFAGSTLRGAIGRSFRALVCITGKPSCDGCFVRANCSYGNTFSPAPANQVLHPSFRNGLPRYVLDPPPIGACQMQRGQTLSFKLLLLPGHLITDTLLGTIVRQAVTSELLEKGAFDVSDIGMTKTVLSCLPDPTDHNAPKQYKLRFRAPLRLQRGGTPLKDPALLTEKVWAQALRTRYLQWCQISEQHPQTEIIKAIEDGAITKIDTSGMRWHDMARQSQQHVGRVPLGGLLGELCFSVNNDAQSSFDPVMRLCETLHIGKETVMGLGAFDLVKDR